MKKSLLIVALSLILALPVYGQAQEASIPEQTDQVTRTMPYGRQHGRRGPQAPIAGAEEQADPQNAQEGEFGRGYRAAEKRRFMDEDLDGICDIYGNEPGNSPAAPDFFDERGGGIRNHPGAGRQPYRHGRMGSARGGCGMRGRFAQQENIGGRWNRR